MVIEASKAKPQPPSVVNAVCVDVVDLGVQETPWGPKERVKVAFESDWANEYGDRMILCRTYTASLYEKASLFRDLSSWGVYNGGEFETGSLVGKSAELHLQPTKTKDGGVFLNIAKVKPAKTAVTPSGKYKRR